MALTPPPTAPDAPGDAPSRANPSTFRALADAFVLWQVGFQAWLASFISWADTNRTELDALQADVTTKQGQASAYASAAATSQSDALAAANSVAYIYPGTYASAPTLRPDGSAIQSGDWYTSTAGVSYRYVSSAWIAVTTAGTGTWSPVVRGTGTPGTTTYSATRIGRYTIIGNLCFFRVHVQWTGQTGTGSVEITLPFTAAAASGNQAVSVAVSGLTYTAGATPEAYVSQSESAFVLRESSPGGSIAGIAIDTAAIVAVSGFYEI